MILRITLCLLLISCSICLQKARAQEKIYGVTIDDISKIDYIVEALNSHSKKMTARIVFNEGVPAKSYLNTCEEIHTVSNIMGELLDSYAMKKYSVEEYRQRTYDYALSLGDYVDIWEIGNESNGEWVGDIDSVVMKLNIAVSIVKELKYKTALTLYCNPGCFVKPENEMFTWINEHMDPVIKSKLDYVLVSYYEDDCSNNQPDWQTVFDSLHILFPESKLGIGECGTKYKSRKADYINRYYSLNVTTPDFIGGYFWWYYREDCVPYTKKLWSVLDGALAP